jgi:hypothetical protein
MLKPAKHKQATNIGSDMPGIVRSGQAPAYRTSPAATTNLGPKRSAANPAMMEACPSKDQHYLGGRTEARAYHESGQDSTQKDESGTSRREVVSVLKP